ncbi:MAG: hypothetical protein ACO36I_18575, partial [Candidatus Latescibacterota bacterium]
MGVLLNFDDGVLDSILGLAYGVLISLNTKESRQRNVTLRGALNVVQCFYRGKPPSPARAVPTPHHVFHTPPP